MWLTPCLTGRSFAAFLIEFRLSLDALQETRRHSEKLTHGMVLKAKPRLWPSSLPSGGPLACVSTAARGEVGRASQTGRACRRQEAEAGPKRGLLEDREPPGPAAVRPTSRGGWPRPPPPSPRFDRTAARRQRDAMWQATRPSPPVKATCEAGTRRPGPRPRAAGGLQVTARPVPAPPEVNPCGAANDAPHAAPDSAADRWPGPRGPVTPSATVSLHGAPQKKPRQPFPSRVPVASNCP